jgi:hypothetical protein
MQPPHQEHKAQLIENIREEVEQELEEFIKELDFSYLKTVKNKSELENVMGLLEMVTICFLSPLKL